MPDTERTPLAGLITYWVMGTVAAELKDRLREHPAAHVRINVPPDLHGRGGLEHAAVKSGLGEVRLNGANLALLSGCHFEVIKLGQALVQEVQPGAPGAALKPSRTLPYCWRAPLLQAPQT